MRTVSAMTMRRQFGGLLDEVRLKSETVVIERGGKPVAMLVPMPASTDPAEDRARRHAALDRLCCMSKTTPRGRDATRWVAEERAAWKGREP